MGFKPRRKIHDVAHCDSKERFDCAQCCKSFCQCASVAVYVPGKIITLVCSGCWNEMNSTGTPQQYSSY